MSENKEMAWTGERLTTAKDNEIAVHHLHRYAIALEWVKGKKVLDIASGEGYGSNLLAAVAQDVIGVDISEEAVNFAKSKYKRGNLAFLQGSADHIPVADGSVDVLISFETLEHHDKHHEMFSEIKRVLKKDGILIMSSPDKLNYADIPQFQNPFHVKELYREEFKKLVSGYFVNLQILYQSMYYGSIIVPEDGKGKRFKEFEGGFDGISSNSSLASPVYNLCIASDVVFTEKEYSDFSVFNAMGLLKQLLSIENEILNSKTYKLGKLMTWPLRLFRR